MKKKLPTGVEIKNGCYQYRHRVPKKERATTNIPHDNQGRTKRVILCSITEPESVMYRTLAAVKKSYEQQSDEDYLSIGWLYKKWMDHTPVGGNQSSRAYKGLAAATQKRYDTIAPSILDHQIKINGQDEPFRKIRCDQLTTPTLRKVLDKKYLAGETPANLNNMKAMLGSMYKYGLQYLSELSEIKKSPTAGLEKFIVQKRTRYVTNSDYQVQYTIAGEIGLPHIQDYMELTYLLAARSVETSELKIGQAVEQGIIVIRTKKSLNTGIKWSPRLKAVWDRALSRHASTHPDPTHNILTNKHGHQIAQSTIHDHWGLVREEMKKRNLSSIYFTAQNLKVKGVKDAENKAIAGQSEAMQRYYQDTSIEVDWFDSPNKS